KTLLVDAIGLLLGAPSDPTLVRPGASEAVVEARFVSAGWDGGGGEGAGGQDGGGQDGGEVILTRVGPASGRSRAYINGRMVAAAQLAETGRTLVDLHGQHAHQALLSPAAQRRTL